MSDDDKKDLAHHDAQIKRAMAKVRVSVALKNYAVAAAWAKDIRDHAEAAYQIQSGAGK